MKYWVGTEAVASAFSSPVSAEMTLCPALVLPRRDHRAEQAVAKMSGEQSNNQTISFLGEGWEGCPSSPVYELLVPAAYTEQKWPQPMMS